MSDYKELVKELRGCKDMDCCTDCPRMANGYVEFCNIKDDAAAAIEKLQEEVDKANKSADAYRAMYFAKHGDITIEKVKELDEIDCHFHSSLIRLMYRRIGELESEKQKMEVQDDKTGV